MTELETIAAALGPAGGGVAVLATLMRVDGSAYRGPGARLVVRPDGSTVGAISGGCLEKDITQHTDQVRTTLEPRLVAYDLTRDDDAPWGLNMGCNARLDVLLEPCAGVPDYLAAVREAEQRRREAVLATCFVTAGDGPPLGARLVLTGDGAHGALADGAAAGAVLGDAGRVLRERRSAVATYSRPGGEVAILLVYIARPIALAIFGEGADIMPLAALGESMGWQVRCVGKDDEAGAIDDRTAAVLMTHNYARDAALLPQLLASPAGYIGVLGPRRRTERLVAETGAGGRPPSQEDIARIHAPVGLDLGAETPREVALAIAGEVLAAFTGRSGGTLRDRQGPIHERR